MDCRSLNSLMSSLRMKLMDGNVTCIETGRLTPSVPSTLIWGGGGGGRAIPEKFH